MKTFGGRRAIVEMNLIPLIDIALILVIIFMVLTPILVQSQLTVKLPKADSGAPVPAETALTVLISRGGTIDIDGRPVKWVQLEKKLSLHLKHSAQKTLLVQADRTVPVEKVVAILDVAKRLGVGKLGIGVAPSSNP
jgi:biopolymer transport protein ExbD